MNRKIVFLLVLPLTIILYSCDTKNNDAVKAEVTSDVVEKGNLKITNAWIRPAAAGMNTAFFFNVYNSSEIADTLLGADSEIAEVVEVHETFTKGEDMMGMRSVNFVEIPAGTNFEFKPMHHHVMLIKVVNDLKMDDEKLLKLNFKNAGEIEVRAKVIDKKIMKH